MKILILLSLLTLVPDMYPQIYYMQNEFDNIPIDILNNMDKMGMDDNLFLTEHEGKFFNSLYQLDDKEYNLSNKKVIFLTGSLGKTYSNKQRYFVQEKSNLRLNGCPSPSTLYIFDEIQRDTSGGYDAAIIYSCKNLVSIKTVVKRLKKKHKY